MELERTGRMSKMEVSPATTIMLLHYFSLDCDTVQNHSRNQGTIPKWHACGQHTVLPAQPKQLRSQHGVVGAILQIHLHLPSSPQGCTRGRNDFFCSYFQDCLYDDE